MQKNSKQAEVWSQPNCPACEQAKQILESNGFQLDVRLMGGNSQYSKKDLFEKIPSARSVPQIIINGVVVGGLPELKKYLRLNDNYKTTAMV